MNTLSALIYAADMSQTVDVFSAIIVGGLVPATVVAAVVFDGTDREAWDTEKRDHRNYPSLQPNPPKGDRPGIERPFAKWVRPFLLGMGVAIAVNVITPSSGTLYAIAASEVGEQVIKSPTATKAIKALDAWLDRQIAKPGQ